MPVVPLSDLRRRIGPGQRVLGLDLGAKRIGLALSDVSLTVATPLATLARARFAEVAERLVALVREHGVGALVIGLPVSMDGSEGPACEGARQFAANLLARLDIAVAFFDERLSTAAVERMLIREADMSRRRRAQVVDRAAAAYILQGALDAMGRGARG
ncbi:MAG: Holliday junction resolvase RuvX [Proteobacteria bacterium]|nr:Holliday junction resolvase RuvX [Pseudomonadota bacterium]